MSDELEERIVQLEETVDALTAALVAATQLKTYPQGKRVNDPTRRIYGTKQIAQQLREAGLMAGNQLSIEEQEDKEQRKLERYAAKAVKREARASGKDRSSRQSKPRF